MERINYYIVDVFASNKYEGNQLAVFLDLENRLSEKQMQQIAKEINFAETTFIKENKNDSRFAVRIFTPDHEVPFAGHPSIGTSYVISKFLLATRTPKLTLELAHCDLEISIPEPNNLDESIVYMRQAQPEFRDTFTHQEIAEGLDIELSSLDLLLPIQEISTGLPYILVPLKNLAAMESLDLTYQAFKDFLISKNKYRTNSKTGHSTSLFFFTKEAYETGNSYNTRMLLIENNKLSEDAATGSANGCFLAYLLTHEGAEINVTVEQGFQMGRKSYLYLNGNVQDGHFEINVGGKNKLISEGVWYF
ncbi:PhzF family phenazine biosynthesis protein [Spirosoma endbachense]|uniref:PhzF family phenazine biosynthesis isomerase n=1 Tax=Spirosoma endbachense TaxID=2666025 RepID=A0A6P1VQV3_9BACT|nr:PhzF family phenazine biosynthesis protein [Spirosoma endbachense]QHV93746.1 PhzF family phenazine biosynthesis isomerase [Spirosoma endbachense]